MGWRYGTPTPWPWLFDPLETHGLGDRLLKAFLAEALRGGVKKGGPTARDILAADLRDVEVRREWKSIDLFLRSRRNRWAFVIDNIWHCARHGEQLKRYMDEAVAAFGKDKDSTNVVGIFLTLNEEGPSDPRYARIGYEAICELPPRAIEAEGTR